MLDNTIYNHYTLYMDKIHNTNKGGNTMERKIKYVARAVRWFDKVNGNTYHSVRITRIDDGVTIGTTDYQYGYDDHYRQTARALMLKAGWLPEQYNDKNVYLYERENEYPIEWIVTDGLKREMIANCVK
jgi:hypothetical protein